MTIADRIEEKIRKIKIKDGKKMSWSRMATDLGFSAQASTRWKKDIIATDTLQKIAEYLDTNVGWLLNGEGSSAKINNTESSESNNESFEKKQMDNNARLAFQGEGRKIPIISYVEAGSCSTVFELDSTTEYIVSFNEDLSDESFALIVKGYSMAPEFNPGDAIIVDKKILPYPGDCVVAQNEGHEATFKKYKPRGYTETGTEIFDLEPINPDYPILRSNVQNLRIIGTVLEHHKKLRRK
ncbi:LexA family transcriptional regulator [Acinetobacter sp. Marseille-Q1618]|uniref:LexA family protein n=1 Tax=Acinetobacter sp. Marseille-Q1618 TaxID=2697502 RepID=UPI0015712D46|nr:LexA family transcriptional regulator [Acinetobacter sp. Marseille-Q1618]